MIRKTPLSRVGILGLSSFQRIAKTEAKPAKGPKQRKCKNKDCRKPFVPARPFITWCCDDCGTVVALDLIAKRKAKEARAVRASDKVKKESLRPRKWWLEKAKTALHGFIRARDEGKPCISCDTILIKLGRVGGDYDAGHFRSVGSAKHFEFEEKNIFGQCKHCNDYLASNSQEYERRLRLRMGDSYVDEILSDNAPRKLTIADFQAIEAHYKAKLKALKEVA